MELLSRSLTERFQQYFDVDFARSPAQKAAVYGIRYRVYCEELKHEPAQLFPDKLERDAFDEHSLHCLITHRSSGHHAGCVRLVGKGGGTGISVLPFEKDCPGSVAHEFLVEKGVPRENMCEVSRLAVDSLFRRRRGERASRLGGASAIDCSQQEKRAFSLIAIAGFLAATALAEMTGRSDVFAMMEPSLPLLMQRAGIELQRAGEDQDYRGTRAAYYINIRLALGTMRADLRELYDVIYNRIEPSYRIYEQERTARDFQAFSSAL